MDVKEKELLIQSLIDYLKSEVESSRQSIERERKARNEAPTARESWSDTTRSQKEGLIGSLGKAHQEKEKALLAFKNLTVRTSDKVEVGALIGLKEDGQDSLCMLVPGLTMTLEFGDKTVEIVSAASPVARALRGHKAGETVDVTVPKGTRRFEILSIS